MSSSNSEKNNDSITVRDNRTGVTETIPIKGHTINARYFNKFVVPGGSAAFGLRVYDAGFMNTVTATSSISTVDGVNGVLRYRGYPIEQLCERSSFMEVAYLLLHGDLPTRGELANWVGELNAHRIVDKKVLDSLDCFEHDAHPMGVLASNLSMLGTRYPEANPALSGGTPLYEDEAMRNKQVYRLLAQTPALAAAFFRRRKGMPAVAPLELTIDNPLSFSESFIHMMDNTGDGAFKVHPRLAKVIDVLFILHAEHSLNCSTAAMRHVGSSGVDPYSSAAAAVSALYGPSHGGANEAVLRMLTQIGTVENIPGFLKEVKAKTKRLMGFGHRVYKNHDPRARIIRSYCKEVFQIVGSSDPLLRVAEELERQALADDYFVKRRLYPNVDFYSGIIYRALGFPTDMFPVLFAIPRMIGWLSHWVELRKDPEFRITRPRQLYAGHTLRQFVPVDQRTSTGETKKPTYNTSWENRVALSLRSRL